MYIVKVAPRAERQLKKLFTKIPKKIAKEITDQLDVLATNSRPANSKKLENTNDFYRVDVSDYRIVYAIQDKELIVLIVKAAHRKEIYSKKLR